MPKLKDCEYFKDLAKKLASEIKLNDKEDLFIIQAYLYKTYLAGTLDIRKEN